MIILIVVKNLLLNLQVKEKLTETEEVQHVTTNALTATTMGTGLTHAVLHEEIVVAAEDLDQEAINVAEEMITTGEMIVLKIEIEDMVEEEKVEEEMVEEIMEETEEEIEVTMAEITTEITEVVKEISIEMIDLTGIEVPEIAAEITEDDLDQCSLDIYLI